MTHTHSDPCWQPPTVERRRRVYEHRITTTLTDALDRYTVRWWIEADEDHGGCSALQARQYIDAAYDRHVREGHSAAHWAAILLDEVPAANSVEVCDATGNGGAAHRDWP